MRATSTASTCTSGMDQCSRTFGGPQEGGRLAGGRQPKRSGKLRTARIARSATGRRPPHRKTRTATSLHAVVPEGADAGEEVAHALVAELARADEGQERRRHGEDEAGDREDEGRIGPEARALRHDALRSARRGPSHPLQGRRPVVLAAEATCKVRMLAMVGGVCAERYLPGNGRDMGCYPRFPGADPPISGAAS
jgi:hypothetical protein